MGDEVAVDAAGEHEHRDLRSSAISPASCSSSPIAAIDIRLRGGRVKVASATASLPFDGPVGHAVDATDVLARRIPLSSTLWAARGGDRCDVCWWSRWLRRAACSAACGGDDDDASGTTQAARRGLDGRANRAGRARARCQRRIRSRSRSRSSTSTASRTSSTTCASTRRRPTEAFIDDINENGGINGRMIDAVFKTHCPIPGSRTELAEHLHRRQPKTTRCSRSSARSSTSPATRSSASRVSTRRCSITHGLSQSWIDEAPPGLLLTPDITAERRLERDHVVAGQRRRRSTARRSRCSPTDDDEGPHRGHGRSRARRHGRRARGRTVSSTITGTDTSAAQAQLDSFIEKWKTEDVDTIIILGETTSAKQFVEKIKQQIPDVQLVVDTDGCSRAGAATCSERARTRIRTRASSPPKAKPAPSTRRVKRPSAAARSTRARPARRCPGPNEIVPGPNGKRNRRLRRGRATPASR